MSIPPPTEFTEQLPLNSFGADPRISFEAQLKPRVIQEQERVKAVTI